MDTSFLDEDNLKYIIEQRERLGNKHSIEELINACVSKSRKKSEVKNTDQESALSSSPSSVTMVVEFFKETYKKKFSIESDEEVDLTLVEKFIKKINKSVEDQNDSINIVKKAIFWYINRHDHAGAQGQRYPCKLKTFVEQEFIWKRCVEASNSYDLNMLEQAQRKNLSDRELISAMRRGDLIGTTADQSPSVLLEKALEESMRLHQQFDLPKHFKKHPKVKDLYTSDIPSIDYIKKSLEFMQSVRESFNDENI